MKIDFKFDLPEEFAFLKSVRFWKLVIIAVIGVLRNEDVIDPGFLDNLSQIVQIVLGGSVIIRTVDRTAEKLAGK